jgi:S1-C subfamily serine protease
MRRTLVERARRKLALKRGGDRERLPLSRGPAEMRGRIPRRKGGDTMRLTLVRWGLCLACGAVLCWLAPWSGPAVGLPAQEKSTQPGPPPSWQDGPAKNAFLDFVAWVSRTHAVQMPGGHATEKGTNDLRRNATVRAVQKVKPSVVAIKVPQRLSGGRTKDLVGTGLIVDEHGYLVTNCHVVAGNARVTVHLVDGTSLPGDVLYACPTTDLAIVRVQTDRKLVAQPLGTAADLEEGEDVIAVGHPLGYRYTVSKGIVSALGRDIEIPTGYTLTELIQTDMAINPGNSGGPLLNINGEVVGINVAYNQEAQNIAFAINSETVKGVLSTQLSALKVSGVLHGLRCKEVIQGERRKPHVVIDGVDPQVAAAGAGVRSGDVILAVGRVPVVSRFDVERALWDARPGEQVTVRVLRDGRELTFILTLAGEGGSVAAFDTEVARD